MIHAVEFPRSQAEARRLSFLASHHPLVLRMGTPENHFLSCFQGMRPKVVVMIITSVHTHILLL